jgi:hypothetical protein
MALCTGAQDAHSPKRRFLAPADYVIGDGDLFVAVSIEEGGQIISHPCLFCMENH